MKTRDTDLHSRLSVVTTVVEGRREFGGRPAHELPGLPVQAHWTMGYGISTWSRRIFHAGIQLPAQASHLFLSAPEKRPVRLSLARYLAGLVGTVA